MFRLHLGRLLNLDWGLMSMAATYGSESVGNVACAEEWPLAGVRFGPSANGTSAAHCEIILGQNDHETC
jgi:hypothetical protein